MVQDIVGKNEKDTVDIMKKKITRLMAMIPSYPTLGQK
jgi:hypothetical protein